MDVNPGNDIDMSTLRQFVNSDAGRSLIQLLNTADHTKVQDAINKASEGQMHSAKAIIESLLAKPEIKKALNRFGDENGK